MPILSAIYTLIIGPLELFFEVLFAIAYRFLHDPGLSIVFISLAMNFLVLPLYRRADVVQEEERDKAMQMKPMVDHIKKTFKGDEQFMMLQAYYRECGYKQTDTLKGSVSLLLEIPFFIAAYHFLSNLAVLRGVSFGPIADLGAPDALLLVGDVSINVLPLVMTAINLLSACVYMKDFPLKNKIQMYGIAAIFLVLLYASPAGLVFYWTLNNIFSLFKNIFYKLKNPRLVFNILLSIVGLALLATVLFISPVGTAKKQMFLIACALCFQIPLIAHFIPRKFKGFAISEATKKDDVTFLIGCVFMALLTGLLIPLSVIQASPEEFVNTLEYSSPLRYLVNSFMLSAGTFIIWLGVFYRLATPKGKTIFNYLLLIVIGVSIVDYLFFGTDYGNMSPSLQFDTNPVIRKSEMAVNLGVSLLVAAALFVVWLKKASFVKVGYISMCVAAVSITVMGMVGVNSSLESSSVSSQADDNGRPRITLSTEGQNVVVIMMDRAVPYFIPYILNEKPELEEKLDGFTFYPNTSSFGQGTNIGSPPLYGGYDYTPKEMNARSELSLEEKQNEALKVMPLLFSQNGYDTTVFDPTYAGYQWIPDLSIYDDCPDVKAYITMDGSFSLEEFSTADTGESQLSRNFFCYSVFRIAPLFAQTTLYHKGDYNSTVNLSVVGVSGSVVVSSPQTREGLSVATGVDETFANAYAVLENLPNITNITDDDTNCFLMMSNDTTHEALILQEPEYIPAATVDNTEFDEEHPTRSDAEGNTISFENDTENRKLSKKMHYHINVAAWQELCDWFDYLRANGVYDNTRIIIVSDHGRELGFKKELKLDVYNPETDEASTRDVLVFNCMLMVKDFDSRGFTVDNTFMTNADTPYLAMEGLINDPVNPFTGNAIDDTGKADSDQFTLWAEWDITKSYGYTFMPGHRFAVDGNVLNPDDWEYLGYY